MTPTTNPSPVRRRWWPRISIRLLLVITALAGCVLALRQRSAQQHAVAARLNARGVGLLIDNPRPQSRLHKLFFGDNKYDSVNTLSFGRAVLTPGHLKQLDMFPGVQHFSINETPGLILKAAEYPQLKSISLRNTPIGREDLEGLRVCKNLDSLVLEQISLDRLDLSLLQALPRLEYVSLSGPEINDQTLSALAKVSRLKNVCIHHARITDEGAAAVARMPNLETLEISSCPITGSCLQALRDSKIQILRIDRTNVDSAAIDNLIQIKHLRTVDLRRTKINKGDPVRLQTARQQVQIWSDHPVANSVLGGPVPAAGAIPLTDDADE